MKKCTCNEGMNGITMTGKHANYCIANAPSTKENNMRRKTKTVIVASYTVYYLEGPISKAIDIFTRHHANPNYSNLAVQIDSENEIVISGDRPETDKEMERRINCEKNTALKEDLKKAAKKDEEFKEYERLKKKFEG